jgi:hypothetical protein
MSDSVSILRAAVALLQDEPSPGNRCRQDTHFVRTALLHTLTSVRGLLARVWVQRCLLIVAVLTPAPAFGQGGKTCAWDAHIRISVLFDNSGTVVGRQRQLVRRAESWLDALLMSLRPGDRVEVYGLARHGGASSERLAQIALNRSSVRSTEMGDSAAAIVQRLFQEGRMVDTTDLRQSLSSVQASLEDTKQGYCGDAIILVTDGALAPFREPSGALPSPTATVDAFISFVARLQREKRERFHYYAVSMGAARGPAIDRQYQQAWERDNKSEVTGEIAEMGGRDLLDKAFGRVYELEPNSLSAMVYRDTSSVYPALFGLRREPNLTLARLQDRNLRYLLLEQSVDAPPLCEARTASTFPEVEWTLAGDRCMLHMSLISRSLRDRIGGSSPWFMYADDFDAGSLPDTITDPHQVVLREQGVSGGENCGLGKLFAAVNDGFSFDSAQQSQYSLRYRLIGERGASLIQHAWCPLILSEPTLRMERTTRSALTLR